MAGFFFNEDVATPEAIDRRRALINALAKDNLSTAPVGHWTAGLARVLGAAADGYENAKLNEQEKKGTDENKRALMAAFGIGGAVSPGAPTAAAGDPASAPAAAPQGKLPVFAQLNGVNPSLIQSESGGNWQAQNNAMGAGGKAGHFGRLQFGQARLQEAANAGAIPQGTTPQQFMADPNLQMAAERWHFADIDKAIANGPAAAMIGKTINGVPVTQEGLRAVAHLGGVGGMNKFVQSGGAYNPADANGTTLMAYMQRHAGRGIAQPASAGPSMQPPASAALVAALGSGQPVNVPPGAPAGTPKITPNNAAPVQPDMSSPNAAPAQAQYNVPGVGLVPAQGVGQAPAASPGAGMTPQAAALIQALSSPWAARNPMLAQVAMKQLTDQMNPNTQIVNRPDGSAYAYNPRTQKLTPLLPATSKAEYGVIGKDQFNREIYGWKDPATQTVRPNEQFGAAQAAAGKPATVQGPNGPVEVPANMDPRTFQEILTKRAAEEAAGPKSSDVAELRKEVLQLPSYKNLSQAAPIYQSMFKTAGTNSRASDLNLVYGLGKIMDPTSVVREGEMVMVKNTASLPDWLIGAANSLNGGQALTPETRAAILAEAHNRITSYQDQYNLDAEHYRGIAGRAKMRPEDVIPNFGEFKPWTPAPAAPKPNTPPQPVPGAPTREQIIEEMLKRGLTPPQ